MPEWFDGLSERLRDLVKRTPLREQLPTMLDPGDPRVVIRPLGDDWLCPYTARRISVSDWDGSSLTMLQCPEIVEHLLSLPELQKRGPKARMLDWDRLVQQTVQTRLRESPAYKVSSEKGEWVCPHCLSNTGVLLHQWDGSEAPQSLFLPAALNHMQECRAYIDDPLGAHSLDEVSNSHGERAVRVELLKRVAMDPVFHVSDDTGAWICPFSERPIEKINLLRAPWGNAVQHAIVEYLLSEECPARYSQWRTSLSVADLQRIAGRISVQRQADGSKRASDQELKTLQQRVENLSKTAAVVNEIAKELEGARQAQLKMLPEKPPQIPGYEIAAHYRPSVEMGGDMYHFLDAGPGRTGFIIGDVSGHGVEAAMIMSMTLKSFAVRAKGVQSPAQVMADVNDDLSKSMERGKFVSAFYAVLEHATGSLRCARAGHPPPLLADSSGSLFALEGAGRVLGISSRDEFLATMEEYETELPPGGVVVLYTDGVPEAMNAQKQLFNEDRLRTAVEDASMLAPHYVIQHILARVYEFSGGIHPHDDVTMVVVKRVN